MAQKARVIKVQLQIADMERHHYQDYTLTLAQHPSETDIRLMIRLLAFALNASEQLQFSRDLSDEGGAELAAHSLSGEIELWILFGQSDEKWVRKACQQAHAVRLYAYGGRATDLWWQQNQHAFQRYANLEVWQLPEAEAGALAQLTQRQMNLQITINEGQVWVSDGQQSVLLEPHALKTLK